MALVLGAFASSGCGPSDEVAKLAKIGDVRELRERDDDAKATAVRRPSLLILAIDGMKRRVLYDLLEKCGDSLDCHSAPHVDYQPVTRRRTRAGRPISVAGPTYA